MTHSCVSAVSATLAGMSCGVLAGWLSQMGLPPLLPVALLVLFVGPALACVVLGKMGVVHARDGLASGVAAAASFGIYWSAAIYFKTEDNPRWVLWVVPPLALAVFGIPSALLAGGLTEVVRRTCDGSSPRDPTSPTRYSVLDFTSEAGR